MGTAESFRSMWAELAGVGGSPSHGYRRLALTAADVQLRAWFERHCQRLGLAVEIDRAGNQWAWWCGPGPGVAVGSHLDSVPDGGAFDGPLGVVSALAAVETLMVSGFTPTVPIGLVNFSDEEGGRFKVACLGSRILTGVVTPERGRALTDDDGITMAEALRAAGRDPAGLGPDPVALGRVTTYVELHIEQGRRLEGLGRPLAVARDIWPHGRWRVDLPGRADHAGTTRIQDRDDAMVSFATVVLAAREAATRLGTVATIGKVSVTPGGVNAIASQVTCWLDARGADETGVLATLDAVTGIVERLGGTVREESWTPATPFDPGLRDQIAALLDAPVIGTGAGHDAGILANAGIPAAMIFVRNPTGVSHSPAEHADEADCLLGVEALAQVLSVLAGSRG